MLVLLVLLDSTKGEPILLDELFKLAEGYPSSTLLSPFGEI